MGPKAIEFRDELLSTADAIEQGTPLCDIDDSAVRRRVARIATVTALQQMIGSHGLAYTPHDQNFGRITE